VVVTGAGDPIELQAWTFCYSNMCADGFPPEDPPAVGDTESVRFEFPLDEWTFEASFETVGQECPRTITVPVTEDGDGTWTLGAAGHPGTYDVTLFGRGNGDLFVTFRWTTTTEGTLPEPSARVAVLADNNGRLETYGVELTLSDLAATPEVAEATITVRSSEGNEHSFTPNPVGTCRAEGTIAWNGPIEDGEVSSRLGTAPFTYEVVVVLDGTMHRSVAMWPSDQIVGNEPSVELVFDPPLPHMT
jgi:hypothetical protein